jgi:hypothetical protein
MRGVCQPSADAASKRSRIFVLVQDRGFNCDGPMQGDAMSRNRIGMFVFYSLEICNILYV